MGGGLKQWRIFEMSRNLQPYQRVLSETKTELKLKLANGRASAGEIATVRRMLEIMETQLRSSPGSVLVYEGEKQWSNYIKNRAQNELFPYMVSKTASEAYIQKKLEYRELGCRLLMSPEKIYKFADNPQRGRSYLYHNNSMVSRIVKVINNELVKWLEQYPVNQEFFSRGWFLSWSAEAGLDLFLEERPDIVLLLRIAQTLPPYTEVYNVPVDRPSEIEAIELAIGLCPIVGNIVAAYEAYAGVDLFGYRLTDLERGILAASILLPIAGRVVKGGRAIYSEARLVAMYGQDAAAWSRAIRAGAQATSHGPSLSVIKEVEAEIRAQRSLDLNLAKRAAAELPNVMHGSAPISLTAEKAVADLFRQLSSKHDVLSSIDDLALSRVLKKGPNVDHIKGQLLEELVESRVVPWLHNPAGSLALGIQTGGKKLEFFPGHLIRDAQGRQITDGILAYRNKGVLEIMAIFEAKAGHRAARELSLAKSSISSLSEADRLELRAYSKDVLREDREAAQAAGISFNRTVEDIEREIIQTERGGQVRRDIERLSVHSDEELAKIRIGTESFTVRLSPKRTKFFGVLPKDVNSSLIERELSEEGFNFEIIGVDISQRDLKSIAEKLVPIATEMVGAP